MSEVGDINRFGKSNQLMAYSGLVPSEHSSGNVIFGAFSLRPFGPPGVAQIPIRRPAELDDFEVLIAQATELGERRASATIPVTPERHSGRVQLGCAWGRSYFCVRVLNSQGVGAAARLFIDVTSATRAVIVNAVVRSNAAYGALYSADRVDYSLTMLPSGEFGTLATRVKPRSGSTTPRRVTQDTQEFRYLRSL